MWKKLIFRYTIGITLGLVWLSALWAGQWVPVAPLNVPRVGASSVVLDGKIYVIGGKSLNNNVLNSVELFDPAMGTWSISEVAPMNIARYNASAVVYEGKIYVTGGRNESEVFDEVEVYDPVQNSWQAVNEMRKDREGHSTILFGGKIYAIGGSKDENSYVDEIEWYDPDSAKWQKSYWEMISPRVAHFYAVVQDTFYMFGGVYFLPLKSNYKCTLSFDWIPMTNWEVARYYGATSVLGDSIFMMGGEVVEGGSPLKTASVSIYNLVTKQFLPGPELPSPRSGATAVTFDNKIYLMGGYGSNSQVLAEVLTYSESPTAIGDANDLPQIANRPSLIRGYPNPFNGQITLQVEVPKSGKYEVSVFDINGRRIKTLHQGFLRNGEHFFKWQGTTDDGGAVASGLYLAVLKGNSGLNKFKMIYVK